MKDAMPPVRLTACLLTLLVASSSTAGLSADPRLSKRVTVVQARSHLGQTVEELSRQTGVRLRVETEKGPIDGLPLTMVVKERTLHSVMEAIVALGTSPYDRWEWRPDSDSKGYTLRHQRTPGAASRLAQAAIQARWVEDLDTYYRIARMPQMQRESEAARRPDLFPSQPVDHAQLDLVSSLKPDQVAALAGGREVPLDSSSFVGAAARVLERVRSPKSKRTPRIWSSWDTSQLGPVLWVDTGTGGSLSLFGGDAWDGAWISETGENWRHSTDPQGMAYRRSREINAAAVAKQGPALSLAEWVRRAAEEHQISIIADPVRVWPASHKTTSWLGKTPHNTMQAFALAGFSWKEASGIYLLRERTAGPNPRAHLVSWADIRSLRAATARNDGYLGLPELIRVGEMSEEQGGGLSEEFPNAHADLLGQWRPVLRFFSELTPDWKRRVATPEGMPLPETGIVARAQLADGPDGHGTRGLALIDREYPRIRVSLRVENRPDPLRPDKAPVRELVWEVIGGSGTKHRRAFPLRKREPLQPQ